MVKGADKKADLSKKTEIEIVTEEDYTKPKLMGMVNTENVKEAYSSKAEDSKNILNASGTKRTVNRAEVNVID